MDALGAPGVTSNLCSSGGTHCTSAAPPYSPARLACPHQPVSPVPELGGHGEQNEVERAATAGSQRVPSSLTSRAPSQTSHSSCLDTGTPAVLSSLGNSQHLLWSQRNANQPSHQLPRLAFHFCLWSGFFLFSVPIPWPSYVLPPCLTGVWGWQ
jgi:hypothetical protein